MCKSGQEHWVPEEGGKEMEQVYFPNSLDLCSRQREMILAAGSRTFLHP